MYSTHILKYYSSTVRSHGLSVPVPLFLMKNSLSSFLSILSTILVTLVKDWGGGDQVCIKLHVHIDHAYLCTGFIDSKAQLHILEIEVLKEV